MHHKTQTALKTMRRNGINVKAHLVNGKECVKASFFDNVIFYDAINKRWRRSVDEGVWVKCKNVPNLLNQARDFLGVSEIRRSRRASYKQDSFIKKLCLETGEEYRHIESRIDADMEIKRLIKVRDSEKPALKTKSVAESSKNPFDPDEPRAEKVNGKVKPFKTIGLQFNRYEWWELEQAVKKSKRSTNSIIREGIRKEIQGVGQ